MVGLGIASQIIRSVEEIHRRRITGQSRRTPRGVVSEVFFSLLRRQDDFGESIPIEQVGEGVLISTVHQAKGLEWPIVILPMLLSRRFPVTPRGHGTRFPDDIAARYGTSIEDERRLFYVAATRAKERLFLIDPACNREKRRSVFLQDLHEQGLQRAEGLESIPEPAWHIKEKDLEPADTTPLRIGLSDLLLYLECPFQFGLRRVVGVEPSIGDELGYGQSLHELIQRRLELGKPWTESQLDAEAKQHVFLPYMSDTGEKKSREAIKGRVRELEKLGLLQKNVETEIAVETVLHDGIVSGVIDLAHVNDDGTLVVRDWKSSLHGDFLDRYERQMRFYTHALREQGRPVVGADIIDIAASTSTGTLVAHQVDTSPKVTASVIGELNAGLLGIAAGKFSAKPCKRGCSVCDMRRVCAERVDT
jgi:DNA helicase-2/ATP-dependent DNA helicase PcrA